MAPTNSSNSTLSRQGSYEETSDDEVEELGRVGYGETGPTLREMLEEGPATTPSAAVKEFMRTDRFKKGQDDMMSMRRERQLANRKRADIWKTLLNRFELALSEMRSLTKTHSGTQVLHAFEAISDRFNDDCRELVQDERGPSEVSYEDFARETELSFRTESEDGGQTSGQATPLAKDFGAGDGTVSQVDGVEIWFLPKRKMSRSEYANEWERISDGVYSDLAHYGRVRKREKWYTILLGPSAALQEAENRLMGTRLSQIDTLYRHLFFHHGGGHDPDLYIPHEPEITPDTSMIDSQLEPSAPPSSDTQSVSTISSPPRARIWDRRPSGAHTNAYSSNTEVSQTV